MNVTIEPTSIAESRPLDEAVVDEDGHLDEHKEITKCQIGDNHVDRSPQLP